MTARLLPEDWTRVQHLFDELVALPREEQATRMATRKLEPWLEAELRSLLDSANRVGVLDQVEPRTAQHPASDYSSLTTGSEIGPFRIERLVGRGGAGEVYLATRIGADFEQRVAIKLLRPEAVDRMGLFDAERRTLATLEHPGIARLIDGGLAPDGRAFMAMEYVEGLDIVRWCAERKADLDARLALFEQVCEAVAYAHRRLVVHRDIKPSNIVIDTDGRARLLDFGVARLLETTSDGQTGTLPILTPEYAAPEQLENRPPTTAADVYGLGAVLFELLTGRGAWGFDDAPMPVVLRRLLHDDPLTPSKAAADHSDAPVPPRALTGDLDAIVLKAMRRNPAERYESVAALAEDLRRHRSSLPVRARDGSGLYLAQRFVRRHRWGVAATAAGVLAVLVGAGGVAWQARATARERDVAQAEAARAEAVNQSVILMFRNAAESGHGGSTTAKELLNASSEQLLSQIDPNNPQQSEVVIALGELYLLLNDVDGAESLLTQALSKGVARNDPVATAQMRQQLGGIYVAKSAFDTAAPLLAQAAAVWRTNPSRFRTERLEAIGIEAYGARLKGDRARGIQLLMDSMPEAEAVYASDSRELLTRYSNLVIHLIESNRLDDAETMLDRADAAARRAGAERSPIALSLLQQRGALLSRRNDLPGAERALRRAATLRRELYGPSTALAIDLLSLGRVISAQGRAQEALAVFDEGRPIALQNLGQASLPVFMFDMSRADALSKLHRPDEAEALLNGARPLLPSLGENNLLVAVFHRALAHVRLEQGRKDEAKAELDRAEAMFTALGAAGDSYMRDVRALRERLNAAPPSSTPRR